MQHCGSTVEANWPPVIPLFEDCCGEENNCAVTDRSFFFASPSCLARWSVEETNGAVAADGSFFVLPVWCAGFQCLADD